MPKEGASLCVSMCVQSVSQPVSCSVCICLCPAVCQSLIGRGLRELPRDTGPGLESWDSPTPPPPQVLSSYHSYTGSKRRGGAPMTL